MVLYGGRGGGGELKIGIHVYHALHSLCFLFQSDKNSDDMVTYSFHWHIMGKVEIGYSCCPLGDIWIIFTEMLIEEPSILHCVSKL